MKNTFFVGAIDQGTTGSRFIIFDSNGKIAKQAYLEHKQIFRNPGWVEHNPIEILNNIKAVIRQCLKDSNIDIQAIGITNQRETILAWNMFTGKPLYNAIVWQCNRTRDLCNELIRNGLSKVVMEKTSLPISTYFSGPKIKWLIDNIAEVKNALKDNRVMFGTMDSWLIWNFTKNHFTDHTNASRTLLMNIKTLQWDEDILSMLSIPKNCLADIKPSLHNFGNLELHEFGLSKSVPILCVLGDQQAALFGQRCFSEGETKNTYGTGNFLLMNTGNKLFRSKSGLLTSISYSLSETEVFYVLEGSILATGAAIQWLRDNMELIKTLKESEDLANTVANTGGVYFVPAFSGLFAPHWDMEARGIIVGITRYTTKAHIARAAIESICYQSRDVIEAMSSDTGIPITYLKVDGGGTANSLLMQNQADILGIEIVKPSISDITSLGAAFGAGLKAKLWKDFGELLKIPVTTYTYNPAIDKKEANHKYAIWKKAVERAKNWLNK